MINRFEYRMELPAEDLAQYCYGGYHPVHLGDCFNDGRYKIMDKLGFGSFSTVWLARDLQADRNVALKIVIARKSAELDHELQILKYLKERGDTRHPGYKHVIHFLDFFYHNGLNGQHLCLVFDALGPSMSYMAERGPDYRLDGSLARDVSAQVLLAVNYLHSSGIVHGDIYPGNILFRVPELAGLSPENFHPPKISKVSRKDGQPSEIGVPDYLVVPLKFDAQDTIGLLDVQLIDFGGSFFVGHPPKSITTPIPFHPPELVFESGLTNAVDIWNLGCTIYTLVTGRPLLEACLSDRELIPQFKTMIGNIPQDWILNDLWDNKLPNYAGDGSVPLEDALFRAYFAGHIMGVPPLNKEDIKILATCIKKMLVLDPRTRAHAHELLLDPWFTRSASFKSLAFLGLTLPSSPNFFNFVFHPLDSMLPPILSVLDHAADTETGN